MIARTRALAALMLLTFTTCARGSAGPPHIQLDFEKYELPNGLEVILHKDTRLPIVSVNLWYHVGPAKEAAGRTGFAHLFEHMMFQGSGHVPEDAFFQLLEGAGASVINGTTSLDRTNFFEDVPANQLELALWLESDRMGFLPDRLDASMLANQQDVVRNERRQRIENAPYGMADEAVTQAIFPPGHPYHGYIMGSHADIQAAKLEDVRAFFSGYYAPNNATLAIVGDMDVEKTKGLIEKYFGTIARGPDVAAASVPTPSITQETRLNLTDAVELPRVYMAWLTPAFYAPGDADADIAAHILGGGKASRLYKALVYEMKIAQDVSAYQGSAALGSTFQITVTAKPGHTAAELEAAIDHELDSLATVGPTAAEVTAAANSIYTGSVIGLESFGGLADRLQTYNHFVDDPGYFNKDMDRYAAVTPASVKAFAAEQLAKTRRVVAHVDRGAKVVPPEPPSPPAPAKVASAATSREPWRNEAPTPAGVSPSPLPAAKKLEMPNGLTVYVVENHALPVVAAQLVVKAGSAADPAGKEGAAGFTGSMLEEGTATRDAVTMARDLEAIGATLTVATGRDGTTLDTRALKQNAPRMMELLADVALAPTFPDAEVERVRNDRLTSLLQDRDSPARISATVMWTGLYGSASPYGHMVIGTEPGIKGTTRDDLLSLYKSAYTPSNAALVLSGDLTESEARDLASLAFGKWVGDGKPVDRPALPATAPEKVLIVDRPNMPQTMLMVTQIGVARSNPDYEKLDVMNSVMGGLFSSRLNMNLREAHGYTYGAASAQYVTTHEGPLYAQAQVRADVSGPAVNEMLTEMRRMLDKEVTPQELALAKESISRSLPAMFMSTGSTAGTVGGLYLYDLPPDYYQGLPARITAMTAAEVFAATKAHLKPDQLKVIAVGDRRILDRQLGALRLGPIGYRLPDGRTVGTDERVRIPIAP